MPTGERKKIATNPKSKKRPKKFAKVGGKFRTNPLQKEQIFSKISNTNMVIHKKFSVNIKLPIIPIESDRNNFKLENFLFIFGMNKIFDLLTSFGETFCMFNLLNLHSGSNSINKPTQENWKDEIDWIENNDKNCQFSVGGFEKFNSEKNTNERKEENDTESKITEKINNHCQTKR